LLAAAAAAREKQKALAKPCQQQVVKAQLVVANDYRADVQVAKHCKADAQRLCGDVKDGGGRVQSCLVSEQLHAEIPRFPSLCNVQARCT
jgi:hypothetical protein